MKMKKGSTGRSKAGWSRQAQQIQIRNGVRSSIAKERHKSFYARLGMPKVQLVKSLLAGPPRTNARRDGRSFELNDEEVVRRSTRHSR